MAKLIPSSQEAAKTYAVGYAYGTSAKSGKQYVRILVSHSAKGTSFSYFSLFETDELLTQCGIDKASLAFPARGEKEKRVAFPTSENMICVGKYVLWSVSHCPLKLPGSETIQFSVTGVSPEEQAELDAERALQQRYAQAESIAPNPEMLIEHKRFINADFVSPDEVFAALNNGKTWQEQLKGLL